MQKRYTQQKNLDPTRDPKNKTKRSNQRNKKTKANMAKQQSLKKEKRSQAPRLYHPIPATHRPPSPIEIFARIPPPLLEEK
jgi:hypothetical protein